MQYRNTLYMQKFNTDPRANLTFSGYMQNIAAAALEQGVDITNSFKKLGSEREWYLYYIQSPDFFEEDIKVIFSLDIDWVD